jgi:hypothetical protein
MFTEVLAFSPLFGGFGRALFLRKKLNILVAFGELTFREISQLFVFTLLRLFKGSMRMTWQIGTKEMLAFSNAISNYQSFIAVSLSLFFLSSLISVHEKRKSCYKNPSSDWKFKLEF